jgi:hypothetical protein
MKMKWKIFVGILAWIALVGLIHYTNVRFEKASSNWNEGIHHDSIYVGSRDFVLSLVLCLNYPGDLISAYWPIRHGVPWFEEIDSVAAICNDILYAFLIALLIWKFSSKPKKL